MSKILFARMTLIIITLWISEINDSHINRDRGGEMGIVWYEVPEQPLKRYCVKLQTDMG